MRSLRSIRTYIIGKLHPHSYLSPELITLLTVHMIFLLGVGLSNTFVNVFLWKVQRSLSIVALYNAVQYFSLITVVILGGWMVKKISLTFNLRLGIMCYAIFFIVLLVVQDQAARYVWILGLLMGLSSGLYYLSYNVLAYDFSSNDNRDYVMSIQGIVFSFTTAVAPLTAGIMIESFKNLNGYIIVFSISFTLFMIAAVLSTKIPIKTADKNYYIKSILFMPFKKRDWRFAMIGEAVRGLRDGVMIFLPGILLYSFVSSESLIGYYTLFCSIVQLLSFYFISKRITPDKRINFLLIGVLAVVIISPLFMFSLNVYTIFIYGLITSFFLAWINNPTAGMIYWVIHKTPNSKKRRIEGIVVREVYLNIGRTLGVLILLLLPEDIKTIAYIVFGLGLSQIMIWVLFSKVDAI